MHDTHEWRMMSMQSLSTMYVIHVDYVYPSSMHVSEEAEKSKNMQHTC